MFARSQEKWSAEDIANKVWPLSYNGVSQTISVHALGREPIYFTAPTKFLGDQRASYNQDLQFKLRVGEPGPVPTVEDVILEGAGLSITQPIFGQGNPLPNAVQVRSFVGSIVVFSLSFCDLKFNLISIF